MELGSPPGVQSNLKFIIMSKFCQTGLLLHLDNPIASQKGNGLSGQGTLQFRRRKPLAQNFCEE